MNRSIASGMAAVLCLAYAGRAQAAGTLTPAGSSDEPIVIIDHLVEVRITNGFARTEVSQVFENPNRYDVEGIYALPLPRSAALSEMTVQSRLQTLYGEVISKRIAQEIYEERRRSGAAAGLAVQDGYQRYEFRVTPIPAGGRVAVTFAYHQPADVDGGVGRYLYPLEEGGTGGPANPSDTVRGTFRWHAVLRSSAPVVRVWVPGHDGAVGPGPGGSWEATIEGLSSLGRDIVLN